jgi:type VI secretion system protein ImpI
MGLSLRIENETQLADGGPLSVNVAGKRNIDIGRDTHLDWTLPDPTRFISSKHAEIRYKDGGYWLHDVSTNGTFLNGGDHRMQAPHRLRNGDRFIIGHYIIAVALDGEFGDAVAPPGVAVSQPAASYQELWVNQTHMPPPIDAAQLKAPRERASPINPDFLDWAADVPNPDPFDRAPMQPMAAPSMPPAPQLPMPEGASTPRGGDDWAAGPMTPVAPPPPPPPELPEPRRPVWTNEPESPWSAEPAAPARAQRTPPATEEAASPPTRGPAPPTSAPAPAMAASGDRSAAAQQFLRRFAAAAGVPEQVFAQQDPGQVADQIGIAMRLMVDNVMQLLNARVQAKRLARSSNHTLVQAFDNNPLKFSPSSEEALRVMFGPPTRSYLDARRAIEQSFDDLKSHQIKTYSAMQHALNLLVAELDPQTIDRETDAEGRLAALMTSRKAKLWDAYVARWQGKVRREGGGLVESFMLLFADCYDRDNSEIR